MTLAAAWQGDTDKGSSVHNYLPYYEMHLVPDGIDTLTEIGVWTGGSLRMWSRWMPHAHIIGHRHRGGQLRRAVRHAL